MGDKYHFGCQVIALPERRALSTNDFLFLVRRYHQNLCHLVTVLQWGYPDFDSSRS